MPKHTISCKCTKAIPFVVLVRLPTSIDIPTHEKCEFSGGTATLTWQNNGGEKKPRVQSFSKPAPTPRRIVLKIKQ